MFSRKVPRSVVTCAIIAFLAITFLPAVLFAIDQPLESALPLPGFAKEWTIDGKINHYTKDNLYTYIDGEAAIDMPYGFSVSYWLSLCKSRGFKDCLCWQYILNG